VRLAQAISSVPVSGSARVRGGKSGKEGFGNDTISPTVEERKKPKLWGRGKIGDW